MYYGSFEHGKIIEDGTHEELLEIGGMYATLYYRQFTDPDASIDDLIAQGSEAIKRQKAG